MESTTILLVMYFIFIELYLIEVEYKYIGVVETWRIIVKIASG